MATKKPQRPTPKPAARTPQKPPSRLENLAAKKHQSFDDLTIDDQLVDASGVFRVTSAITQAQVGHGEESARFANDSLVMQAQRDGFPDDGPTIDQAVEEHSIEDEASRAEKKSRLATLAARARQQRQQRRR
jgi:hypothetical protein